MGVRILQDLAVSRWHLEETRLDRLFGKEAKGSPELLKNLLKFTRKTTLETARPFLESAWEARKCGPKGRGERIWTCEDIKRAMEAYDQSYPSQEGMMTPPPTETARRGRPRKVYAGIENGVDTKSTSGTQGSRKRRYNSETTISVGSNDEEDGNLRNDKENIELRGNEAASPVKRKLFKDARPSSSIASPKEPRANLGSLPTPNSPSCALSDAAAWRGSQAIADNDKDNGLNDVLQSSDRSIADAYALLHLSKSHPDETIKGLPSTEGIPQGDTGEEVSRDWAEQMIAATVGDSSPPQSSGFHKAIESRVNSLPDTPSGIEPPRMTKEPVEIHAKSIQPGNNVMPHEARMGDENELPHNLLHETALSSAEAFEDWQARIYPLIQEHAFQYKRYERVQTECTMEWNELAKAEESVSNALSGHEARDEQAQKAIRNAKEATKDDERRFKNDLPGDEDFFNLRAQQAAEYEQRWVERREEAQKSIVSLKDELDVLRKRKMDANARLEQVQADMIPWAAVTKTVFWDIARPRS